MKKPSKQTSPLLLSTPDACANALTLIMHFTFSQFCEKGWHLNC